MKKILSLIFLLNFSLFAEKAPNIHCKETTFNFGAQDASQTVKHTFVIENTGESTLKIGKIRSCCGSTAVIDNSEILPGKSSNLNIELKLKGRKGKQKKNIFIASNDPDTPYFHLKLVGEVQNEYALSNSYVYWKDINDFAENVKKIDFTWQNSSTNSKYQVTKVESAVDWLKTELIKKSDKQWQIVLKTTPNIKKGRNYTRLKIHTDHPKFSEIPVSVTALVKKDIVILPEKIALKDGAPRRKITRFLSIRSKNRRKFTLKSLILPKDSGITYKLTKKRPFQWICQLIIDTEVLTENTHFELETDLPNMSKIPVPVEIF